LLGTGQANAIRTVVSYAYRILDLPGDDSTMGSKRATVWNKMMIAKTDMFDVAATYPSYANLYVENGFLTTKQRHPACKSVGVVLGSPTTEEPLLRFLFDPEGKIEIG
jgi:hypothetical protein